MDRVYLVRMMLPQRVVLAISCNGCSYLAGDVVKLLEGKRERPCYGIVQGVADEMDLENLGLDESVMSSIIGYEASSVEEFFEGDLEVKAQILYDEESMDASFFQDMDLDWFLEWDSYLCKEHLLMKKVNEEDYEPYEIADMQETMRQAKRFFKKKNYAKTIYHLFGCFMLASDHSEEYYQFVVDCCNVIEKTHPCCEIDYMLGILEFDGVVVDQDLTSSFRRLKRALAGGIYEAGYPLGLMYYYGKCVKKSYRMAYQCFAKAAEVEHLLARLKLADMRFFGQYVEKDLQAALIEYTEIATTYREEGKCFQIWKVMIRLAWCSMMFQGDDEDLTMALSAFTIARSSLYEECYFNEVYERWIDLAKMYHEQLLDDVDNIMVFEMVEVRA